MQTIDAHNHLWDEPGYLDRLIEAMDDAGVERVALSALGPLFNQPEDDAVRAAFEAHPDRVIGQIYARPGVDGPDKISRGADQGFRMVKVTCPRGPYNDTAFYPLWERAVELDMPVLCHTGIVTLPREAPEERVSSWDMHPMRLEPVTRAFPELRLIVAHLGIHWNEDAAELARMRANVYVDITGEPGGWRARMERDGLERWLWWPDAFGKVVFGTDVHCSKVGAIVREDRERFGRPEVPEATQRDIFAGNLLRLLGETE